MNYYCNLYFVLILFIGIFFYGCTVSSNCISFARKVFPLIICLYSGIKFGKQFLLFILVYNIFVNNNKQVLLNSTLNDSSLSTNSFKQYGLNNWRQYAAEKHGNSKYFQESAEGRKCIENAAIQKYAKEMLALKHWADEVEKMAQQLLTQANADSEIQLLNNRKVDLSLFMWIIIMVYI